MLLARDDDEIDVEHDISRKDTLLSILTVAPSLYEQFAAASTRALEHVLEIVGLQGASGASTPPPSLRGGLGGSPPSPTTFLAQALEFFQQRSTVENTTFLLAVTTFAFLAMSWSSRLGNLGRFSPFTRSPPQHSTVRDADFSYITADDLRRHQAESMSQQNQPAEQSADLGDPRDTDILILRNKRNQYAVHFPAYSIAKGELTVGQVRDQAAKKVGAGDARRIKLLFAGKNLKDDGKTCREMGLRENSELMLTVAEGAGSGSDSESDDEFDGIDDTAANGETKRKRNRGKKSKRRKQREERGDGASGTSTPQLGVPGNQQSRTQSPKPPVTPLEKLDALHEKLQTYMPDCRAFEASPPADPAKREFEHKRLSETILAQVLLKLDAVETEGDADARSRRKELVRETQNVLNRLDGVVKGA